MAAANTTAAPAVWIRPCSPSAVGRPDGPTQRHADGTPKGCRHRDVFSGPGTTSGQVSRYRGTLRLGWNDMLWVSNAPARVVVDIAAKPG